MDRPPLQQRSNLTVGIDSSQGRSLEYGDIPSLVRKFPLVMILLVATMVFSHLALNTFDHHSELEKQLVLAEQKCGEKCKKIAVELELLGCEPISALTSIIYGNNGKLSHIDEKNIPEYAVRHFSKNKSDHLCAKKVHEISFLAMVALGIAALLTLIFSTVKSIVRT